MCVVTPGLVRQGLHRFEGSLPGGAGEAARFVEPVTEAGVEFPVHEDSPRAVRRRFNDEEHGRVRAKVDGTDAPDAGRHRSGHGSAPRFSRSSSELSRTSSTRLFFCSSSRV